MIYHCDHCNYSTQHSSNWCVHKKSAKHMNAVKRNEQESITLRKEFMEIIQSQNMLIADLQNQINDIKGKI